MAAPAAAPVVVASEPKSRDQRRQDAVSRDATARQRKPIEQRIRRIETKLAEAEAARKAIDAALAAPDIYEDAQREKLKQLVLDQAYRVRDIEQLEAEWLEQQALLEQAA